MGNHPDLADRIAWAAALLLVLSVGGCRWRGPRKRALLRFATIKRKALKNG